MPGGTWRGSAFLCVCVALLGVAGCGDDGGDSTAQEPTTYSMASEPPRAFALRLAKLLETSKTRKDCQQVGEISARSLVPFRCPSNKGFRESMGRFEIVGAEAYGTGAVVDYRSGGTPDGAAIVLYAAPDRNWGVSRFGVLTEPSARTSDARTRAGFRKAVENYLTAVGDRDCRAFATVAFTGDAKQAKICEAFPEATRDLAKRMKADPAARPKYQGGNGTYGFFSFETAKPAPVNETISVIKGGPDSPSPFLVLDIAQSPTAAQHAATIELLEQDRTKSQSSPSPSKKAD
jgi:hypothetical protein